MGGQPGSAVEPGIGNASVRFLPDSDEVLSEIHTDRDRIRNVVDRFQMLEINQIRGGYPAFEWTQAMMERAKINVVFGDIWKLRQIEQGLLAIESPDQSPALHCGIGVDAH